MNWMREKRAAEHAGRRLDRQRLRQAGHALDQQVPLGEQADEHALEHVVLSGDHSPDLEERLLEAFAGLRRREGHRSSRVAVTFPPWSRKPHS